jgi:hypothetical protein
MTARDRGDLKLNCVYAALSVMGANSAHADPKKPRPTTEEVLVEAKKISKWVSESEEGE